jgi:hypothetical protein
MSGPENVFAATVEIMVGRPEQLCSFRHHLHVVEGHQPVVGLDALVHCRLIIDQRHGAVLRRQHIKLGHSESPGSEGSSEMRKRSPRPSNARPWSSSRTKTADQLDLQALHRVRERLVGQRTGVVNQIRAFLLERGIAVRQRLRFLRIELPGTLATRTDVLSPRMLRIIEDLAGDWRRLDGRIEGQSSEIETLASQDKACERLMTAPGIGPIISSAMVVALSFRYA